MTPSSKKRKNKSARAGSQRQSRAVGDADEIALGEELQTERYRQLKELAPDTPRDQYAQLTEVLARLAPAVPRSVRRNREPGHTRVLNMLRTLAPDSPSATRLDVVRALQGLAPAYPSGVVPSPTTEPSDA
jgi:hypothetical protein